MIASLPTLESAHIAVIGLGYVGLPLLIALSKHYRTIGFDINPTRIE
ncbi:MAG: Vi polysaccharide biosynthesis UDP-N-acetylglucosamine C-6 dehydrogenase TviB, partial [Helicobacter japonicus]|nr:Vi polysaccharide biosynthesis UDP-N-acetylglucosamine C-6 dehydrogenase TviB [Helicobacter japonicus]